MEIVPLGNGWVVRNSDTGKFIVITDKKQDALTVKRSIEKSNEIVMAIQNKGAKKTVSHTKAASALIPKSPARKRTTKVASKRAVVIKS